ncbi:hypothetical protein FNF27_02137 [Cafeteria roenbergensis]|uniref:Uncharacterized protein n=1 Tax=Cafeteria roenbergensis TaxID=33653 RepID=A0A5A8EL17_CAFRO|nr:hypothetical protein FNF27_02137 [Cafeteria roenbergensis]
MADPGFFVVPPRRQPKRAQPSPADSAISPSGSTAPAAGKRVDTKRTPQQMRTSVAFPGDDAWDTRMPWGTQATNASVRGALPQLPSASAKGSGAGRSRLPSPAASGAAWPAFGPDEGAGQSSSGSSSSAAARSAAAPPALFDVSASAATTGAGISDATGVLGRSGAAGSGEDVGDDDGDDGDMGRSPSGLRPASRASGSRASGSRAGSLGEADIPDDVSAAGKKWSVGEDARLRDAVDVFGTADWKRVAAAVGNGRTTKSVRARWAKLQSGEAARVEARARGAWSKQDDEDLRRLVLDYGGPEAAKWSMIAKDLGERDGKQCRDRWYNHVDPTINHSHWTDEEDDVLFCGQVVIGNRWSEIARIVNRRTENMVKNRYNSRARQRWLERKHSEGFENAAAFGRSANVDVLVRRVQRLAVLRDARAAGREISAEVNEDAEAAAYRASQVLRALLDNLGKPLPEGIAEPDAALTEALQPAAVRRRRARSGPKSASHSERHGAAEAAHRSSSSSSAAAGQARGPSGSGPGEAPGAQTLDPFVAAALVAATAAAAAGDAATAGLIMEPTVLPRLASLLHPQRIVEAILAPSDHAGAASAAGPPPPEVIRARLEQFVQQCHLASGLPLAALRAVSQAHMLRFVNPDAPSAGRQTDASCGC